MVQLQKGTFFGNHNQFTQLGDVLLTDTEYTLDYVDWHYHKNPYFTFILTGAVVEGHKRGKYECGTGALLYHQCEDPHYNIKQPVYTRGFHIELENSFFERHHLDTRTTEGSTQLESPLIKTIFYQLYAETRINDTVDPLAVEDLLLRVFGLLAPAKGASSPVAPISRPLPATKPAWVSKIRQALYDLPQDELTYSLLSEIAGIHPAHLSRDFPKYFHTSVGDYLRKMRLEKALALLAQNDLTFTDITYRCGFADQSHFIRTFRHMMRMTPNQYRKMIGAK